MLLVDIIISTIQLVLLRSFGAGLTPLTLKALIMAYEKWMSIEIRESVTADLSYITKFTTNI